MTETRYTWFDLKHIRNAAAFVFVLLLQYVIMEWSVKPFSSIFSVFSPIYILFGLSAIAFADFVLLFLFKRGAVSIGIVSTVLLLLAITNHFTYLLHGEPFTLEDVKNAKTAFSVLGSYKLSLEKRVIELLLIYFFIIAVCAVFLREKNKRSRMILPLLFCAVLLFIGFFSKDSMIPKNPIQWSWERALREYGYTASFVQQSICGLNAVQKPNETDEEHLLLTMEDSMQDNGEAGNRPDVFLILNESFYDLDYVVDTGLRSEVFSDIDQIDNLIYGYSTSPVIGGGTNKAEYELLTSNSLRLIPTATPFVSIELTDSNSIVSHLEHLGYTSLGTHPYIASNYNRESSYQKLGFDDIRWQDAYEEKAYYAQRDAFLTDQCTYKNLICWYEEQKREDPNTPFFIYCLTVQNHGGWDVNQENMDLVRTPSDFGEFTDDVNEYQSCMKLSTSAFVELTEYFATVDRDIIIIMTGDHSPSFASKLTALHGYAMSDEEQRLRLLSTPFLIWSNNSELLDPEMQGKTISKCFLVPEALRMAGVPLSGYYNYMTKLCKEVPILTSFGYYYDCNGNLIDYEDRDSAYYTQVNDYFCFEYRNIKQSREFNKMFW